MYANYINMTNLKEYMNITHLTNANTTIGPVWCIALVNTRVRSRIPFAISSTSRGIIRRRSTRATFGSVVVTAVDDRCGGVVIHTDGNRTIKYTVSLASRGIISVGTFSTGLNKLTAISTVNGRLQILILSK